MSHNIRYFTVNANDVINIIFVKSPDDMVTKSHVYKPKMTHQIFEKEAIFGYSGLEIDLYYSLYTYHCYAKVKYDEKWQDGLMGMSADDIIEHLSPWFRNGMLLEEDDFKDMLLNCEKTKYVGGILREFNHKIIGGSTMKTTVNSCDLHDDEFKNLHRRFESLIIMYIDAANFIDMNDANWKVIYLYEKKQISVNVIRSIPIGFCTLYHFPAKRAARISQFFIVPPYQKMGLGCIFLATVYTYLRNRELNIRKFTVESPNDLFTELRDKVDVMHCLDLPVFQPEEIKGGFTNEIYVQCMGHFKFSKKQSKRIYYIIRAYFCEIGLDNFDELKDDFIKDQKLQIIDLGTFSLQDKDEIIEIFKERINVEEGPLEKTFETFMESIQNVIKYLKSNIGRT